jgi:hypothetical protein
MTMEIKAGQRIAGLTAKALRDFLRKFHTGFSQDWMVKDLEVSVWKATRIIRALLRDEYIEPEPDRPTTIRSLCWYRPTMRGQELIRASAARRVTRKTAQMALDAFMQRVHQVNRDPRYLCTITKVAAFGSFLTEVDRLGDVGVAVEVDYRIPKGKNLWRIFQKHALESGRNFPTLEAEQAWPRREVMLVLKARKRTLRLQSWYSFTQMEKAADFRYEVLLGDKAAISRDLEEAERERKDSESRPKQ